jgi:hypothetical protein
VEFRLTYRGPLKTRKATTKADRQTIRRGFHSQLKTLWLQENLAESRKFIDPDREIFDGDINLVRQCGLFKFAPLVSQAPGWHAVCSLNILFLRPSEPGQLIGHEGDLDNRIKTLLDTLRMPTKDEIETSDRPSSEEHPFFCLLEDDALVTELKITTDRLLTPTDRNCVELVIGVRVRATRKSMGNDPIW